MAISIAAKKLLGALLPEWHLLLQEWSASGRLTAAAQEALVLNGKPQALTELKNHWAAGDFGALPPIVLLSSADINGALGAYALSTGTVYLNADWLAGASNAQAIAVLTEELGHHLDALLNTSDTPGDEGKRFAVALGLSVSGDPDANDAGVVLIGSERISVERAALPILTLRNVELVEGTGSTGPLARLEYVLDRASTEATSFSWATVDDTAKADSDYEATSGAITIAAGSLTGFVEVRLKADAIQETAEAFKVALSNANFLSFSAAEATVSIVDDDKAGIRLTAKESLETSERGGSDSFQLVLKSQPSANVSIDLSVSDNTEGRLSTNRVVFTPNNWNQPVTIKLSGLNDIERDGNVAYAVITANSVSTDPYYNNIEIADLAAVNIDSTAEPPASDRLLVTAFTDVMNATDGLLTLREAILQSNNSAGGKQIELAEGTYNFSIAGEPSTGLDGALQGDLDILTSVTIKGAGSAKTIINAKSLDRLFEVFPNITLKLEGLTLREGKDTDGRGGGALFNSGDLLLKDVVISNNWSPEWGGGLYLAAGSTTTGTDVSVLSNRSEDDGGGIYAAATAGSKAGAKLQFNRAKINSNSLSSDRLTTTADLAEDVYGGGLYVGSGASAELIEAEITGNTAKAIKEGAWVEGVNFSTSWSNTVSLSSHGSWPGFPTAVASRWATNSSDVYGGGIYSIGSLSLTEVLLKGNDLLANSASGTATSSVEVRQYLYSGNGSWQNQTQTTSTTLTQPSTTYGDGIYTAGTTSIKASTIINSNGPETIISTGSTEIINSSIASNSGGTALKVSAGETKIGNTIVAQNAGSTNPDVLGSFVSLGNNLIGDGTGATGFTAEKNDQIGVPSARINPLLADLASNGGFTQSLALRQGSPAIDNGNNAIAAPLDQRSYLRPINGRVDIGAYESFSSPFSISVADASLLEGSGGQRRFDVSVTLAAAAPVPVTVALKTADGTAIAGSDYTGIDTTLYFAPGETQKQIGITINSDTIIEPNETFSLNLSNPSFGILGTATATLTLINDDVANGRLVSISDNLTARVGNLATIPLQIDNAKGVQALDLLFSYDPNLFSLPDVPVIAGTLTTGWTFTTNPNPVAGTIRISAFGSQAITAESGSLAQLQLNSKSTATLLSTTPLTLREAQLNEGGIPAAVDDGTLRFIPDSFQILSSRTTASGVVLELSEAPDLTKLNLYDGQDVSVDTTDVVLSGAVVGSVPLSLYWDSSNRELHLLATSGLLTPDSYTLRIDSRSDGLVTADGGRLLDGDRNGSAGGPFLLQFTNTAPPFSVAVPDLLRGPGQALSLNGAGIAAGVPLRFSLASAVSSITGKLEFNSAVISAPLITAGSALPVGWQLTLDTSKAGVIAYTISGSTPLSDNNLNLLQFTGTVAATAPYASSSLLKLSATANNGSTIFSSDPGLVKIAYPGDTTGNYGYSALDASRIARVAVGLDSGFDPFGNVDPVLIADVTGNGKISSLDAAKVLSRAVGIDVAEVGALPNLLTPIVAGGPDPIIQVGTINAAPGDSVTIPLSITDSAAGVQSLDLTLRYDATKLEITAASTAGLTTGWTLLSNTSKPGEIKVSLFTTTALTGGTGTIINLSGKVLAGAAGSSIALDLVQDPAAINEGELMLTAVDGQINLPGDPPLLGFSSNAAGSYTEEPLGGSVEFTLQRSGTASQLALALTVPVSLTGTAIAGLDYTLTQGTSFVFAAGAKTATVSLPLIDDSLIEGTENIIASITLPAGYAAGSFVTSCTALITEADSNLGIASFSINGNPTVGGAITASKNSDDPDGFSSSLKYEWEASADGRTWALLTTADASDNNSTYTLTASEVGKKIRAVVSYVDGDGTKELVHTAESATIAFPAPTYALTPSSSSINEGATLTTTVATANVASGTTLYWSIGGTGINATDFSSGALTGLGTVGTDGKFSFAHTASNDATTEGEETLQIKLFSDSARTVQAGSTATATIKDTSLTPAPTYALTPSRSSINEGATLTTTVATTNVTSGTTLYWSVVGTGVTASDFSFGALTGSGTIGTDGKFSFVHTIVNDLTTEGDETLQFKLFSDSARTIQVGSTATVTVIDTSLGVNTKPTAVQSLTGSSKVGRVLTADKSTIVDPDGVPTSVSYGWEVSTNGSTWTKLTSADAIDNNSTYALTAGDLGKTIRSVISYTDGNGTNETISSVATTAVVAGNKPTSINLSSSNIVENVGANVAVARLSSLDVDTDDSFKYLLVSGTGSTDNSMFTIAGDKLVIKGNPDYENKNSYSIRVRTTDLGGLIADKSLVLKVANVNEAPDTIYLSDTDFQESISAGSVIASLTSRDPDRDTAFTYSLTPSSPQAPSTDNQFFSIVNDQLKINASANFEQKDSYTISVRSTDAGKLFYDQVFTLVVQDVDEAPTSISITGTGIEEGAAVGSIVGSLVSTDQDESSTDFTYELVAGTKANNNNLFEIAGDQLKAKATFNFETMSSYVVNVRTTDESGLTFTQSITIKVNNVNENPTDLTVSATAFNENVSIGSTVATLKFVDPDTTGTYTYSLVSGVGDKDNQAFLIAGSALKVNVATNFEIQKSYSVRLRVTDQGGLFFEKSVALGVNNLIEKVSSAVSTTLVPDKDTLELTGTKNIFGMGNQFDNTITGNTGKNKLTGGLGKDILKGGAGVDTFFYNDLKESLLSGFDVITDYSAGEKIISTPFFEGDDLIASTGKATAFNEGAISSVLTNTTFLANNASAFTVEGLTGTFLALNDGRDGFQADSDALIHLSKYTIGSTTPISII